MSDDDTWRTWLAGNGHDTAPLTGQDSRAMEAIDACWHLYSGADSDGRAAAVRAVVALLGAMQAKCWPLAKALIPRAMDWPDETPVWARVAAEFPAVLSKAG